MHKPPLESRIQKGCLCVSGVSVVKDVHLYDLYTSDSSVLVQQWSLYLHHAKNGKTETLWLKDIYSNVCLKGLEIPPVVCEQVGPPTVTKTENWKYCWNMQYAGWQGVFFSETENHLTVDYFSFIFLWIQILSSPISLSSKFTNITCLWRHFSLHIP